MRQLSWAGVGCAAALLLALPARGTAPPVGEPAAGKVAQDGRSRFGFPDWDSRSGRYDRSRRAEAEAEEPKGKDGEKGEKRGGKAFEPFGGKGEGGPRGKGKGMPGSAPEGEKGSGGKGSAESSRGKG